MLYPAFRWRKDDSAASLASGTCRTTKIGRHCNCQARTPALLFDGQAFLALCFAALPAFASVWAAQPEAVSTARFHVLSSSRGELPFPGVSTEQTGAVVADFDQDGTNDFVLSFRRVAPALVWYRPSSKGWSRTVIEPEFLTVEAGGAVHDIDGDGDIDLVFGGDWQSNEVSWWENPGAPWEPARPWKRRPIKTGGANQHHDQVFGDFLGKGKLQLAFWNQGARKIFLAEIPADVGNTPAWPLIEVFSAADAQAAIGDTQLAKYPEGMSACDVDGDGKTDLLAGNAWFKHRSGATWSPVRIGSVGGLICAGRFTPGKYPQVVIAPGDGIGPVRFYECAGDPTKSDDWKGRDLLPRPVVHGHSLQLGDVNQDGHLDIFVAEMAKWSKPDRPDDNPSATSWILFGDGVGQFRTEVLSVGVGFHEARLADFNGDGRLDILNKPYTWKAPRIDLWLQR